MANSVFKLKVETSEYDANIKKAAEGIQHLASVAHKAGGELTGLDKAEIDYLKTLGDMPTMSRNAASATRELEKAYKELTVVYNNLNDVEKADEGGKALAASLDKLRQRAQESRQHLDAATQSLQNNGQAGKKSSSILDNLASKFTINIDAIKLFKVGLNAAEGALNVAKDAFFASEATVDEWGRTMEASKSVYQGFLNALNTGDISGYLDNINDIVNAARTAYNELDRLRTMKRIQSPQISSRQAENDRLRMMIQSGRYIAPIDGRKATMQNGQILTPEQIKVLERQLQSGMQQMVTLVGNEVKQSTKAINAVYDKQAKELGLTQKEFRKGTSSMEEFDKRIQGYQDYRAFERQHTIYDDRTGIGHRDNAVNPYEAYKAWGVFRVDGDKYGQLVQLIQQRDQQMGQAYGMQSQAYRAINKVEGITPHKIVGGGGTGGGGITPQQRAENGLEKAEQNYQQALEQAALELQAGTITRAEAKKKEMQAAEARWKAIGDARNISDSENLRKAQDEAAAEYTRLAGEVKQMDDAIKAAKIKWETGASGFNAETMTAWMKGRQGDLQHANYGTEQYNNIAANIADMTTIKTLIEQRLKAGMEAADTDGIMEQLWERVFDGENIPDEVWQLLTDKINEKLKEMNLDPLKIDFKTGEVAKTEKDNKKNDDRRQEAIYSNIGRIASSVQGMFSTLESMGIEIPDELQSMVSGLQSIMEFMSAMTALITTIAGTSTIKALPIIGTFAHNGAVIHAAGGAVTGNTYSGDKIPAMLNAGEVVLNRAQTGNIASQLSGNNGGGQNAQPFVTGDIIYLGLQNYLQENGYGKLMTTNMR